jgi:hypothetical protein
MLRKKDEVYISPAMVRPITLMNVSYKLYTAIWANRLQKHKDHLFHKDQVGFVKGRNIHENT